MRALKYAWLTLMFSAVAVPASADDYIAYSRSAEAITGDISMDDDGISFSNGKKLVFGALVADSFLVDGKMENGSVFEVAEPSDPVLLNGNRLCGEGRVTYVATWGSQDTILAVFTTQDVPASSDEMCASYTYTTPY
jgi:hypothetical protein